PGIAALPPTTIRQLGSHQLLTNPSSVVKELVDNALDARAKSIFVEITTNTIDSIQVKDDGHGIPSEDRALACRRYCTSKIRDFQDLKEVGGKWLGFRGEALASLADMSGTTSITTRVEGEPVAVKLTYQRNGELLSTERDSHPVGTVRVTKLLESAKVRKEMAAKGSAKWLARIRRLIQAYALARPAVRFRLHVFKAKNHKGDFIYAPKANANVEDAALKIIGKECALQCDWTALEMDGFELQAFLPKPAAIETKIANQGAFISVDFRPVSPARGTLKKIAAAVRDMLRKANQTLVSVKDPFFYLNIICPIDSYDPNIEPAKDDMIFGNENFIVGLVDRLLATYYPEHIRSSEHAEASENAMVMQPTQIFDVEDEDLPPPHTPFSTHQDTLVKITEASSSEAHGNPRWRSSMYGIDAEDLDSLQKTPPPTVVEEEGCRDVEVSNPWTIARMNAPIKPKQSVQNTQLLSPTKSQSGLFTAPQSPVPATTPRQSRPVEPLTPRTRSRNDTYGDRVEEELQQSICRLPQQHARKGSVAGHHPGPSIGCTQELPSSGDGMSPDFVEPTRQFSASKSPAGPIPLQGNQNTRRTFKNKPYVPPTPQLDENWFGQPMRNTKKAFCPQKRPRQQAPSPFAKNGAFSSQMSLVLSAAERLVDTGLASENDTDIRDFFGHPRRKPAHTSPSGGPQPQHIAEQLRAHAEQSSPGRSSPCRPRSADSYQRNSNPSHEMDALFQFHHNASPQAVSNHAPRPQRRRTTGGDLHRTKSSTLPLNFVPRGCEIHNVSLIISTSISFIAHHARKLDSTADSLQWGYDSTDAFDVFSAPVSERRIMDWVIGVDGVLHAIFARVDSVEVRGALHEGVQRFLD
ncbi:hypothetical protein EJ07DRAFT_77118, partial [Lizonia empirigonia]